MGVFGTLESPRVRCYFHERKLQKNESNPIMVAEPHKTAVTALKTVVVAADGLGGVADTPLLSPSLSVRSVECDLHPPGHDIPARPVEELDFELLAGTSGKYPVTGAVGLPLLCGLPEGRVLPVDKSGKTSWLWDSPPSGLLPESSLGPSIAPLPEDKATGEVRPAVKDKPLLEVTLVTSTLSDSARIALSPVVLTAQSV